MKRERRETLRIRILDALEVAGAATCDELAVLTGSTANTVRQHVHLLMDDLQVEECGKHERTNSKSGPRRKLYAIKGAVTC